MPHSVAFVIGGMVETRVLLAGNLDGTLSFEFTSLGAGRIADLGAVVFDLTRPVAAGDFRVYGDAGLCTGALVEEGVDTLGRTAVVRRQALDPQGVFDLCISFAAAQAGGRGARTTGFTLAHDGGALTLDMIDLAGFGLRFTGPCAVSAPAFAAEVHGGGDRRDALEVIDLQATSPCPLADEPGGALAVIDLSGAVEPIHALEDAPAPELGFWEQPFGGFQGDRASGAGRARRGHWSGLSPLN